MDTLAECFKTNIGPHFAIGKAIGQEKEYAKSLLTRHKLKIWIMLFLASLIPFSLYSFDVSTDSLLIIKYKSEKDENFNVKACEFLDDYLSEECLMDTLKLRSLAEIPEELSTEACFNYSLAFILFPIISFAMEWYSNKKENLKIEVSNIHISTPYLFTKLRVP